MLLDRRLSIGGKEGQDRLMFLRALIKNYKMDLNNGNLLDDNGTAVDSSTQSTVKLPSETENPLTERVDEWDS
jgi:hypothetical protein